MKILMVDPDVCGLDFSMRSQEYGHEVRLWVPKEGQEGEGMVEKPKDWKPSMEWADLVVLTANNKLEKELAPYFKAGFPILGANKEGARLELDREYGQQVLEDHGMPVLPNTVFEDYDEAITFVEKTRKRYVSKPWGGNMDKSISYVSKRPDDMIFMLEHWKKTNKLKGAFMLQERVDGVEIGVSGWFGPGGWCSWIEEDWEEKRLMNEGLGPNTGEQGTVIRYVKKSKLFEKMLRPLTEFLHSIGYVGNVNVNCIIDKLGNVWPLEFTMRLGWPAFNIHQALQVGDPAEWLLGLLRGQDLMQVTTQIAVGVVISHGDYPTSELTKRDWKGFPIRGITENNYGKLHFQQVMRGVAPVEMPGRIKRENTFVTAGDYVMVVTGTGGTVAAAREDCYHTCWQIDFPSDRKFRTDIGKRLRDELPLLQEHGYARGMEYGTS